MYRAGIVGVSGYTGIELLRILSSHSEFEITYLSAGRAAGTTLIESWPALAGLPGLKDRSIEAFDVQTTVDRCDVVFLALPHGVAAGVVPALMDAGVLVVDLGADFRLQNPALYKRFYTLEHPCPERLTSAVYGLVELNRLALPGARLIANPGCYPTAVSLAAWPVIAAGLAGNWITADCLSGASGAGRKPGPRSLYCEVSDSARPYGVAGSHRHVPEIEQTLGVRVTFTPHLAPMVRGMIATVHVQLSKSISNEAVRALYEEHYAGEAMIALRDTPPATGDARGTNRAHIHVAVDAERQVLTSICVIDNLVKGASGQAVQALNVALNIPEATGLPMFPVLP